MSCNHRPMMVGGTTATHLSYRYSSLNEGGEAGSIV